MEDTPTPMVGVCRGQVTVPSMESWSGNELGWLASPWVWGCPVVLWVPLPQAGDEVAGAAGVVSLLPVAEGTSMLEVGVLGTTPLLLWFSAWSFSISCCGPQWRRGVKGRGAWCAAVRGVAESDMTEQLTSNSSKSVVSLTFVTLSSVSGELSSCRCDAILPWFLVT